MGCKVQMGLYTHNASELSELSVNGFIAFYGKTSVQVFICYNLS